MRRSVDGRGEALAIAADESAQLRRMVEGDLDAILAIEAESFAAPWPRSAFELAMTAPELLCLVADAETVAGYLIACPDRQDALIANVAVASAQRHHGYGRQLIEAALRWATGRNATSCRLDVRMSNKAAQRLYERLGFRPVGRRRGYYPNPREDALTMVRVLDT